MPTPVIRWRGVSCATPASRSTNWCAGCSNAAPPALRCSEALRRRCSRGCRPMCSGGSFRSRAMRWTALCSWLAATSRRADYSMATEHISPRYVDLDSWSTADMLAAMHDGQLAAAAAVRAALPAIGAAVDDAAPALQRGGRIVYVGAGTSGRIGVQDGTELTPSYDWPAERLVFAMAGGMEALVRS